MEAIDDEAEAAGVPVVKVDFYFIVRYIIIPLNCSKLMNEGGGPAAGQVGRRLRPPLPRHLSQLRRGGRHLLGRHQSE